MPEENQDQLQQPESDNVPRPNNIDGIKSTNQAPNQTNASQAADNTIDSGSKSRQKTGQNPKTKHKTQSSNLGVIIVSIFILIALLTIAIYPKING